jgi:hypothetical protein
VTVSAVAALNGVLLVDKSPGPTSHDVVEAARRALRTRSIGHRPVRQRSTGSLRRSRDPIDRVLPPSRQTLRG